MSGITFKRIEEKEYEYAPFHNELKTLDLPPVEVFKNILNLTAKLVQL